MYDWIGGEPFIRLYGDLAPQGVTLKEISRPGVDGRAWQELGQKAVTTTLTGIVDALNVYDADGRISDYVNMQGQVVTIFMRGLYYPNFLILKAYNFDRVAVGSPVGGVFGGSWVLRSAFDVVSVDSQV